MRVLALRLNALKPCRRLRIAIDGVDGAGKTCFADELAAVLASGPREVIRASVDGFHRPRAERYARGRHSPAGFFFDSYDYATLKQRLLDPLGPEGDGRYCAAAFDHLSDMPVEPSWLEAAPTAMLLFDGIFLQRPELNAGWDLRIFLAVDFAISIPRGAQRGTGDPNPAAAANQRYIEGQKLYLQSCRPEQRAELVIDHTDLDRPLLRKGGEWLWPGGSG